MQPEKILRADIPDLIFENRNKGYGAYQLRKEYAIQLIKALCISVSIIPGLFILIPFGNNAVSTLISMNRDDTVILSTVDRTPPDMKPPANLSRISGSIKNIVPLVVPENSSIRDRVPTQIQLSDPLINTVTRDFDIADSEIKPWVETPGTEQGKQIFGSEAPVIYDPDKVQQPAAFPGASLHSHDLCYNT